MPVIFGTHKEEIGFRRRRMKEVTGSFLCSRRMALTCGLVLVSRIADAAAFTGIGAADRSTSTTQCPFLGRMGTNTAEYVDDLGLGSISSWLDQVVLRGDEFDDEYEIRSDRALGRYDHYNSDSAYNYQRRNGNQYKTHTTLSDVWLCLACALGWTVWLVSTTRAQTEVEQSIFESQESRTVHGNVLQVSLGQAADGTGIPVYHTLVDYVVESTEVDEEPMQVRKCFSTRKLLEEGFANVEVLVLCEDPTTSILMDDFLMEKNERAKKQMEPPSLMYAITVYLIAALLILTSLLGGLHAYKKLHSAQKKWGKISLIVATILLYPVAVLLYHIGNFCYRSASQLAERPGVIIHGARDYWKDRCGATLNPLEVLGTFDDTRHASPKGGADVPDNSGLEMRGLNGSGKEDLSGRRKNKIHLSPLYPNAGCGFGNFNVSIPRKKNSGSDGGSRDGSDSKMMSTGSISSMSSATGGTHQSSASMRDKNFDPEKIIDEYASLQIPNMVDHVHDGLETKEPKEGDFIPYISRLSVPSVGVSELASPQVKSGGPATPRASNSTPRNLKTSEQFEGAEV